MPRRILLVVAGRSPQIAAETV